MLRCMSKSDDEKLVGDWVTARCRKRSKVHSKPMPKVVRDWLDTIEWNPAAGDTEPTPEVREWLIQTIDDPDWPEG